MAEAFAFEALLMPYPESKALFGGPVVRTIAVRDDQTLEQLHEALRLAFGWGEPHLYSFWLSGKFWDGPETEHTAPDAIEDVEPAARSARVPLRDLRLRKGKVVAYVFDFGDQWRLRMRVVDRWEAEDEAYPMLVEAEGTPPPQYEDYEDEIE